MKSKRDGRPERHEPGFSAQDRLRVRLLSDALGNCLPMAHITSVMTRQGFADTPTAQQDLVLRTIRSLLDDGLMEIGDILGGSDERIESWNLPPGAAVKRVRELFVGHHDEPALWEYTIWLGLTPAGERSAHELRSQAPS